MTAGQRRFHARLWSVWGAVILLGLGAAVAWRPPAPKGAAAEGAAGGGAGGGAP